MHARLPESAQTTGGSEVGGIERRGEPRDAMIGALWMIDNPGASVMRCRCIDMSRHGMRLRVPLGYGIREGRHYELCSHRPGQAAPPGLGLLISRGARVIWTRIVTDRDGDELEVGVTLDSRRQVHALPRRPKTQVTNA